MFIYLFIITLNIIINFLNYLLLLWILEKKCFFVKFGIALGNKDNITK